LNVKKLKMVNFDEILTDISKLRSVNIIVLLNCFNVLMMEYGNPILFTLSATGSVVYIWLKIKREFFTKKD